ncbi:GNAT family N-acetyltransferase [Photobacterium halotolerans]|uniref:GNAT family N-acetyltransferase n=1 Tax=Photobacterium halotolerans TaxID=265726 RepID=UPI00200AAEB8|nr:GNAT family N-acetyltransferase [Photobacterium halotolerans]
MFDTMLLIIKMKMKQDEVSMDIYPIRLRKATWADMDFLLELRDQTMRQHLQKAGAPTDKDAYKNRILYHFDDAQIVEIADKRVGLFKAFYQADLNQWYLAQIQILPEYQSHKIGWALITELITKATDNNESVALSVLKDSPARRLYERLGFQCVSESELEFNMLFHSVDRE